MTRCALTLTACLLATGAAAQEITAVDDEQGIGIIVDNVNISPKTPGESEEQVLNVQTSAGPVKIRYVSTPGGTPGGCCDDHVEVYDVPPGHIARPVAAAIPEGEALRIHIIEYQGI